MDSAASVDSVLRGALRAREKLLVHLGTTHVLASVALVGARAIAPGQRAFAQLRIDAATPVVALPGDRFILRGFSPTAGGGTTVAGGQVIRVLAPRVRRGPEHAATVAELATARVDQRIALEIAAAAAAGLTDAELVRRVGIAPDALAAPLALLIASGELLAVGTRDGNSGTYLHSSTVVELEARIVALVGGGDPDGVSRAQLRMQLPAALPSASYDALVAGLVQRGILTLDADRIRRAIAARPAAIPLSPTELVILERFRAWGVEPPRPKELATAVGMPEPTARAALDRLIAAKLVVRIKPDLMMAADVVAEVRGRLLAFLDEHATIDPGQWKALTGASRKYTIPLAEYFDADKLTLRVGDVRRRR